MSTLQDAMNRLEQRFSARGARPSAAPPPATPGDDHRLLFAASALDRRPYLESVPLHLPGVGPLIYRGQRLAADDRAVWRELLTRAARSPHESWLCFPSLGLLRAMGWGVGAHDRGRLRACLERLQAAWVRVPDSAPGSGSNLALIAGCQWQALPSGRSDRWRVQVSPEVQRLFANWTRAPQRRAA